MPEQIRQMGIRPEHAMPWQTIPAMLADNLVRHAPRTAVVDGAMRLTYAELEQRMQCVAAGLRARNLGRGDVVALWAPNSWQWVVCVVASWWCGCTVVPIPARGKILDAMPILRATRAKLLFSCSDAASGNLLALIDSYLLDAQATLQDACPALQAIVDLSGDAHHRGAGVLSMTQFVGGGRDEERVPVAAVAGEDICEILFTSGSTGIPKGVPRRHDQVVRNRWANCPGSGYNTEDCLLVVSEFSHTLGMNGNLLRSLLLGATLVIAQSRNPAELAALIRDENVTVISAPPSLFASLLREQVDGRSACSRLRLASTGAANIPPSLVRELIAAGVGTVVSGYGMTECDTISSTGLSDSAEVVATTVGVPEAGLEVQITDAQGAPVATGVEGELWIRGYVVASAYLGASGQPEPAIDAEGWLHSGDMGCFTAQGYLQILGRKKDVMTIHGYTLYPAEVEALLSQSGMLKDIAVIGVPHAVAGELCVAFIVPADASTFSLKQLRLWARTNVADYKIPGRFVLLDRLPLNLNGKVDRLYLKSSLDG